MVHRKPPKVINESPLTEASAGASDKAPGEGSSPYRLGLIRVVVDPVSMRQSVINPSMGSLTHGLEAVYDNDNDDDDDDCGFAVLTEYTLWWQ